MNKPGNAAKTHLMQTDLSDRRALIVDRHPNARDSLRMMLSGLGMTQIHGAGSTTEVLRQVKANSFDIIFSDYVLEDGRDGQQLLEELRIKHLIPLATVFIIVTSERGYHNVVSVAELTPDDYLVKPFTSEQLLQRLGRAIFRKSALARIYRQMDASAFGKALTECERVLSGNPELFVDALRLKCEILNLLGRYEESDGLLREVLATRALPWAKMALAVSLRARRRLSEAETLARELIKEHPHFLSAYDFLARVLEEDGRMDEAQEALIGAAEISPHNTARQRVVGDIAARNGDLDTAEKAYQTALNRVRGSSISSVEDYANLSRVLLNKGKVSLARSVVQDLRRERKWDSASEMTALIVESQCHREEGNEGKAKEALEKALAARSALVASGSRVPEKITIDLAHSCLVTGEPDTAKEIMRQVAGENPDDAALHAQVRQVFEKVGDGAAGGELLAEVMREIVAINNKGVLIAREGDLEGAVSLLTQAADRMPNIQFLVNASNAIFTLLERGGWQPETAERAVRYLLRAQQKDPRNNKVITANEMFLRVANKYGVSVPSLRQQVIDALRAPPGQAR